MIVSLVHNERKLIVKSEKRKRTPPPRLDQLFSLISLYSCTVGSDQRQTVAGWLSKCQVISSTQPMTLFTLCMADYQSTITDVYRPTDVYSKVAVN